MGTLEPIKTAAGAGATNATTTAVTLEKDNTEEAIAMSASSNAFKASRTEDNDNHAAVGNIKGSSTNPTPSALSTSDGNNEISARNGTGNSLTGNSQPAGPSLLPNEEDYRGKSAKNSSKQGGRSQRAQIVLDSFPLLDFMQSHVLSGSLQATSAKL